MQPLRCLFAAVSVMLFAGCSANHHAVFRHQAVDTQAPALTAVDAKQRVILASKAGDSQVTRFCAEPSPDVFAVFAQALSLGGSFGRTADPKAVEAAIKGAFSSAEQGSTIPRTQTTNLLRELMYRTCERHLNGGYGELDLPLQAIRDQRLMVSVLAIEQLTGTVTPAPITIAVSASADAGQASADLAGRLDDARKEVLAKRAAERSSQEAHDKAFAEGQDCAVIAAAVKDGKTDSLTKEQTAKRAACDATASSLVRAKADHAEAVAHHAKLDGALAAGSAAAATRTAAAAQAAQAAAAQRDVQAVTAVTAAVRSIVRETFAQDEFLLTCLKILSPDAKGNEALKQSCLEFVRAGVELRTQQTRGEIEAAGGEIAARVSTLFDAVWPKLSTDGRVDPTKLAKAREQVRNGARLDRCLEASGDREALQACFGGLPAQQQRDLAAWRPS